MSPEAVAMRACKGSNWENVALKQKEMDCAASLAIQFFRFRTHPEAKAPLEPLGSKGAFCFGVEPEGFELRL